MDFRKSIKKTTHGKKVLLSMILILCMIFSFSCKISAEETARSSEGIVASVNGVGYTNLDEAIKNASDGDTVKLENNVDYVGVAALRIEKAIVFDLNQKTLTTHGKYGGIIAKGGCSIQNGTITHNGTVAAIKLWNVELIDNLTINVTGVEGKTIGGIVLQEGTETYLGAIKNTKINGATNGIETYNCGNAARPVIGEMYNVTIDAENTGMLLSAPCGTATDCNIYGKTIGINMYRKGTFSVTLELLNCQVSGDTAIYVHDEVFNNATYENIGKLELKVDSETIIISTEDNLITRSQIGSLDNATVNIIREDGVCCFTKEDGTIDYYAAHSYSQEWTSEETIHYHECLICDAKKDEAQHNYKEDKNQYVAPTCNATGKKVEVCETCKAEKITVIPSIGQDDSATTSKNGNKVTTSIAVGDNAMTMLLLTLLAVSTVAFSTSIIYKRKKNY